MSAIGDFLGAVGGSAKFGAVTNIFSAAASLYGIITSIIAYAEGTPPEPSTQDIIDAVGKLQLHIDDLAGELRQ